MSIVHWDARGYGLVGGSEERDRPRPELVGRIGLLYHPDSPAGDHRVEISVGA